MTTAKTKKSVRELSLDGSALQSLSADEQAFLVVVCHATSEINTFGRLAYFSVGGQSSDKILRAAQMHQNLSIIRCFSAKLFELTAIFQKRKFGNKSDNIVKIYDFAERKFEEYGLQENYNSARNIRDFVTNHYDPARAKKNLAHLSDGMDFGIYLTEPDANSFAMIGEEISFTGQFNREFSARELPEGDSGFARWWRWNQDAWRWTRKVHAKTVEVLLLDRVPNLMWRDVEVSVPSELISEPDFKLPIFVGEVSR